MDVLREHYPWTKSPLIACGPMRLIALAPLAFEVSKAGGLGFLGAGSDVSTLSSMLEEVKNLSASEPTLRDLRNDVLPIGVGFLLWAGRELLEIGIPALEKYPPAAVWFFAPNSNDDLVHWTKEIRRVTANKTRIWIQVPSVSHAVSATRLCAPDVLVIQGQDAGGHGLHCGAGLLPLFPEAEDAVTTVCATEKIPNPVFVAAGGILEARTAAAALALGASGIAMGTRYLLTPEANIAQGYREAVMEAKDGGRTTGRTKLYDQLRGTTDWPVEYGGRGVLNESYYDAEQGMDLEENKRLYKEALNKEDEGWGAKARLTTYAGTGVGLVREVMGAGEVTREVREGARRILRGTVAKL